MAQMINKNHFMERIIFLLNRKIFFLEKFYSLNEKQIKSLKEKDFRGLDLFYSNREEILKIIHDLDKKLGNYIPSQTSSTSSINTNKTDMERFENIKEAIQGILERKTDLINRIVQQDLEILTLIDQEKNSIINELKEVRKTKSIFGKYRFNLIT